MIEGKDPENSERIRKHRERREHLHFTTIERPASLSGLVLPEDSVVLLEDIPNLLANEMFSSGRKPEEALPAVLAGLEHLLLSAGELYLVTGDLFGGGGRYDPLTDLYLKNLGAVHRYLASRAEYVTEVVYGLPVKIKETSK
jgi:adenosylcobinamide kinase/adenosylcobinamide-phosphate guanylyltransferase